MKNTKSLKTRSKGISKKNNPPVVMITIVLTIFAIIFLSFISYKLLKSKRVVIDMGQYVLINENNINSINPGKIVLPTTPPYVNPPTTLPNLK